MCQRSLHVSVHRKRSANCHHDQSLWRHGLSDELAYRKRQTDISSLTKFVTSLQQ